MLGTETITNNTAVSENDHGTTLPDGTPLTIRKVQPGDVTLIDEMHTRISRESLYYRYLGVSKPSLKDLRRLCELENEQGVAVVATVQGDREKVIGLACFGCSPLDTTHAEPAVLVEDQYQRCGVGKRLMGALFEHAVQRGIAAFECYIHPTNQPVLHLIKHSGLSHDIRYNDGLKEVRIWLNKDKDSE